jgi:leucyl/phenylalanyl-tRNA--protein transferase
MITLTKLNSNLEFPNIHEALQDPNGLLAFGGDLSCKRLLKAYSLGIFPWYSDGEPVMWWSPDPRGILPIDKFTPSKSLKKFARQQQLSISVNMAFSEVVEACAHAPRNDSGTWITQAMVQAYKTLHEAGHAHSIEVWQGEKLVGGLYGVVTGKVFCGESMFHRMANCSKLAFWHLVSLLKTENSRFIDCQMQNPHLASLGCIEVSRKTFQNKLKQEQTQSFSSDFWQPRYLVDKK